MVIILTLYLSGVYLIFFKWKLLPFNKITGGITVVLGVTILTLFLVGLMLCRLFARRGDLALVLGLHAGWVATMQDGVELLGRQPERLPVLFGTGGNVARTYPALMMAILGAVLVVRMRLPGRPGESKG